MSAGTPQQLLPCKDTIIIPQFVGTCWMNALLMCVFYSEAMRDVIIMYRRKWASTMPRNEYTTQLVEIFDKMARLYKRPDRSDGGFYKTTTPEKILYLLHKADPILFEYRSVRLTSRGTYEIKDGWKSGYTPRLYARKLLHFFGIQSVSLDAIKFTDGSFRLFLSNEHSRTPTTMNRNGKTTYSYKVKSRREVQEIVASNPPIISVNIGYSNDWKKKTTVPKPGYYSFGGSYRTLPQEIRFGKSRYILDTVTLSNVNKGDQVMGKKGMLKVGSHSIAGVTCNGNRFIYSGWMKKTKDAAKSNTNNRNTNNIKRVDRPCPLMPFKWDTDRRSFYITSKVCDVQFTPPQPNSVRFNSIMGNRVHYYVRSDLVKYKTRMLQRLGTVSGKNKLLLGGNIIRRAITNAGTRSVRLNQPVPRARPKVPISPRMVRRRR